MNPNPERDERVPIWCVNCGNQIYQSGGKWFHLSTAGMSCHMTAQAKPLYDSQAAEMAALRKEVAASERYQTLLLDQPDAATRMRDRCLEKVKQMRGEWESTRNGLEPLSKKRNRYDAAFCAANEIITALQSLTLEGEQGKR